VDNTSQKLSEIIDKSKQLKKGMMNRLFARGIGHGRFNGTEIGVIPNDWRMSRLGEVCEVVGGGTPSTKKREFWDGDIPWATPTDITSLASNTIDKTEKEITQEGLTQSAAKLMPVGSILLTTRATIGECAINVVPMATNQCFINLICKNASNWFIFHYLRHIKGEMIRLASGSTLKEISKQSIRTLSVPIPSLKEQEKVAEILNSIDAEIEHAILYQENLGGLKHVLMRVLLTGKVRVKV
jgi:type I restriction enzyme S subunit